MRSVVFCYFRSFFVLAALMIFCARGGEASTIVTSAMPEPVDFETSPAIRLVSHGPLNHALYRVTLEVDNSENTDSLFFTLPEESLYVWFNQQAGEYEQVETPKGSSTVNLRWDNSSRDFPARRLKPAYTRGERNVIERVETESYFLKKVEIEGGKSVAIDIDFDIPRETPESLQLFFNQLKIQPGVVISESSDKIPVSNPPIIEVSRKLFLMKEGNQ